MSFHWMYYIKRKEIILGIDPGLRNTGWAIIETMFPNLKYIKSGVIKTSSKKQQNANISTKLTSIFNNIKEIIKHYKPTTAAIENTYVNRNSLSSLKLAQAKAASIIA